MIAIFGPDDDPDDTEAALEEMELEGAGMLAIAIRANGDAVLATEYGLEQTENILTQLSQIVRLSRAN